ncbi:MAG: rod shape-determining protein RodA [Chloroflexi bacterium]|nr:rod shape-determining protein RodA [Chloroflexota bacterium]
MRLSNWRHFDFWLLGAVSILIIFSIAMIDSAIAGNIELVENNTLGRQILFAGAGFIVIALVTILDYHVWITIGRVLYVIVGGFLAFIAVGGETAFGAARWLDVGFALVQPSELAKITVVIIAADFFAHNQDKIAKFLTVIRSAILPFGLVFFVIIQPDLSTSIVLLVIWGALLFASGLRLQHILIFLGLGTVLPFISWPFLEDYQKKRVAQFIFPDETARFGEEYNVLQSQITVGSGGLTGQGYRQGSQVQLRFLKVRHSDFIFSAIAEEFGFIGSVIIILILFFIIFRILRAAQLSYDTFGSMICYGIATLIAFQTVVNIGMNLTLLPVTGLPLPFISQGGSSLISLMLGIGLVESVIARHKVLEF